MVPNTPTIETTVTLKLSQHARSRLDQKAANSGQDISAIASDLIEHAVDHPSVDEILAPGRKQVAESGMTDEELDNFHRDLLVKVRSEKKANST